MTSNKEYTEKLEENEAQWKRVQLIEAYRKYLARLDRFQVDSVYKSDSFELGARRIAGS